MYEIKTTLFAHCFQEYKAFTRCEHPAQREEHRLKFCALYSLIETLELEEEYQIFKKYSPLAN